jgi:hypothetical protein
MKFIVSVREVHVQMVEVEADSEADAVERVNRLEGVDVPDGQEFSHRMSLTTWTVEKKGDDD